MRRLLVFPILLVVCFGVSSADANPVLIAEAYGDPVLVAEAYGAGVTLPNSPAYDWWYGCSPTSVGMMLGHYDINGYNGLTYDNLVPGGTAELNSWAGGSPLANAIIASPGHIADFYSGGYLASGDDVAPPHHSFNSLADFMGTSQDSVSSVNGSTWFYNFVDGSKLYAENVPGYGITDASGMYGIGEYIAYAGYGTAANGLYNQYIDTLGLTYGFSFGDYMAEIDAGRNVIIHIEGHSMFGYGYDAATTEVIFHDTWDQFEHRMTWGGSYSGMGHRGVTVMELTGGDEPIVPETASLAVWSLLGMMSLVIVRRRRKAA